MTNQNAPAQIVWSTDPQTGSAAWQGPGAFAEPEREEPAAQPNSLASAWASWSADSQSQQQPEQEQDAPEARAADAPAVQPTPAEAAAQEPVGQTTQPWPPQEIEQPADEPRDEMSQPEGQRSEVGQPEAAAEADVPSNADPQAGWVQPGTAQTADEVHQDWNDQHGELRPSTEDPDAPRPDVGESAPVRDDHQHHSGHAEPQSFSEGAGQAPSDEHSGADRSLWGAGAAAGAMGVAGAAAHSAQQDDHAAHTGPDDHADPQVGREEFAGAAAAAEQPAHQDQPAYQEQAAHPDHGSREAWQDAHDQADGEPLVTDPSSGDAVPAPPQSEQAAAGGEQPQEPAEDDSLTIGRSRENSIVLNDMLVSRRHVRISADEQGLLIEDLGSRNGTFVNGERVDRAHIHEGDRISVGATTFEVRDGFLDTV